MTRTVSDVRDTRNPARFRYLTRVTSVQFPDGLNAGRWHDLNTVSR